ncbi:TIGR03086 family metal-binding protein [Antrihabitans spumae]|uniref:TIGR03086 family metal-binding protein n=1 Tax=Antrihabitans spumae TaxID=3373370 RepID=A0ABW7KRL7_9NOCA
MNTTSTPEEPTADRYRRLAAALTDRVDAVPAKNWDAQSPCEGWTARDVLRHVVESQADFVTKVDLSVPPGPSVDDDPSAAWHHTRDAVQSILDDPAKADREYDGGFGTTTLRASFDTFFCADLIVHGWDIAHATGIEDTIDAADLEWVDAFAKSMGPAIRTPGAFGPELDAPVDADQQTAVLAFLGRKA